MSELRLSEKLLAGLAGWEVIQLARSIVAENRVLSASWEPPCLRGVVQSGSTSYRAGLVIHRENDAENLCTCRQSREWGTICAHSVAVGLQALKPASPAAQSAPLTGAPATAHLAVAARNRPVRRLQRAAAGAAAENLEIHVILPPNLEEGLSRGKGTAFLEGRWSRGRVPLSNLPLDRAFAVDQADERLLDAAEGLAGGDTPAMLQLSMADFASLLEALVGHPRVTRGKTRSLVVRPEPWRPPVRAALEDNGDIVLRLGTLPCTPLVVTGARSWVLNGDDIQPLELPTECLGILAGPVRLKRPQVPAFVSATLPILRRVAAFDADFDAADFELQPEAPRFVLHLAGGLAALTGHLQCLYGPRVMTVGVTSPTEELWLPDPQNPRRYSTRDLASERRALERLLRCGFSGPNAQGLCHLNGQNAVLTFLAREFRRLEREWRVTLEERLERSTRQQVERIEPRFTITPSGEQWFDVQVTFGSRGGELLPATEVQRLLRGGQSHTRLKNGKLAILDTGAVEELEELLVDCAPQQHAGGYRISRAQSGFVQATLEAQGWEPVAPEGWRQRARQQTGEVALACPDLGPLESVLRPYQRQGVAWIRFLREEGFGGILADEMGLGKTLQTLAHLQALPGAGANHAVSPTPDRRPPHLVVCPTSVVSNWVAEAARFTPGLRVLALHGPGRQARFGELLQHDLVVTSYALIRRDLEFYRTLEFDTVILDEAQHIKNRQTRNAQAVKAVRSRHRLVLTGTPLENSVLDLWSIFDFLMPGYLGSAEDFRERYEAPIAREKDAAAQQRLARRVRPFLLRRLKRDVAPELPARIEQVVWCELSEDQAAIYEQLLAATRREVTEAVGVQGLARSRMLVLTALLRLRQVCCDLRLLETQSPPPSQEQDYRQEEQGQQLKPQHGQQEQPEQRQQKEREQAEPDSEAGRESAAAETAAASGKLAAFSELLQEVLDGGHRVLVFSQFTRVLGLLRENLSHDDIRFSCLDGNTRDRGEVVAAFQTTPDIPVFLISLKAGGVGLNLTAADTVIHFDPWWNPAVEDQATDRAHRIGQSRVVTSYKLITRGTVEEKILSLQQRKREVIGGVLAGEEHLAESLSWDEIQELLS